MTSMSRGPALICLVLGALILQMPFASAQFFGKKKPILAKAAADPQLTSQISIDLTNEFRKEEGLGKLKQNDTLTATAQAFADFMARTGKYGHEADGRTPAERADAQGYDYAVILENIAYSFRTNGYSTQELAEKFVQGWKDSPPHRKAMVHPHTLETGVAVARADSGYYYAVQLFGRPASEKFEFRVVNQTRQKVTYQTRTVNDPSSAKDSSVGPRQILIHGNFFPTEAHFPWMPADTWIRVRPDRAYTIYTDGREFMLQDTAVKK